MSIPETPFRRPQSAVLASRLTEPRRFLEVVAGPRQVGKSTLVQQVTERLEMPVRYASADEPTLRGSEWISQQWEAARLSVTDKYGAVLVLDEIQTGLAATGAMGCAGAGCCATRARGRRGGGQRQSPAVDNS